MSKGGVRVEVEREDVKVGNDERSRREGKKTPGTEEVGVANDDEDA